MDTGTNGDFWAIFRDKIQFWITYEKNLPWLPLRGNEIYFDEYRRDNDLDCRLAGGDLRADTIFSLWIPLRYTLVVMNGLSWLQEEFGEVKKRQTFLQKLLNYGLEDLLPCDEPLVQVLQELFVRGCGRENVMILLNRGLNDMRAQPPYLDYMPYFLRECFQGGKFFQLFNRDMAVVRSWMMEQELQFFFQDGYLLPESLLDLARSGDITQGHPMMGKTPEIGEADLLAMLQQYNEILKQRREVLLL